MRQDLETKIDQADSLLDVLLILKELTMEETHVSTLAYFVEDKQPFENGYGILTCKPFPLDEGQSEYLLDAYYFDENVTRDLEPNDVVFIVFTDKNFINNLKNLNGSSKETLDVLTHNRKFAIVVGLKNSGGVSIVKSLNTTNTIAQTPQSNEGLGGLGIIQLHKISKTGSYDDLSGKPTIPTKTSQLTNDSGFITTADLSNYVPTSRTINGKALTNDISLTASDVGALPSSTTYVSSVNGNSGAITGIATTSDLADYLPLAGGSMDNKAGISLHYPTGSTQTEALNTSFYVSGGDSDPVYSRLTAGSLHVKSSTNDATYSSTQIQVGTTGGTVMLIFPTTTSGTLALTSDLAAYQPLVQIIDLR